MAPVIETIATGKRARFMALQNFAVRGAGLQYYACRSPWQVFVTPLIAAIVMSTSSLLVTANARGEAALMTALA